MRIRVALAAILFLTLWTASGIHGQITSNPIPARIEKRGLAVEIRDEGQRVAGMIERWEPPFSDGWERFQPDPGWTAIERAVTD